MKKQFLPSARSCILPAFYLAMKSLATAATPVSGTLINVDFNGTGGAGGSTNPVTFDGDLTKSAPTAASVALEDSTPETNDFWNGFGAINQTGQPLSDSKGAATAVTLSWSGFDGTYTNYLNGRDGTALQERTDGPNGDGHLLFGAGSNRSGTVVLGGLDPGVIFDVAAIGGGSDPVKFTIGTESQGVGEWSSVGNRAANWRLFSSVVPNGAGQITITVSTNGTGNFGIGGVQLTPVGTTADTDGDGMPDVWENANGLDSSNSADGALTLNVLTDPDGDTIPNRLEFNNNTNPQDPDTDADGYRDNVETNSGLWVSLSNTGTNPLKRDTDGDGLADGTENLDATRGSDPNKRDTDGDGFNDAEEIRDGTDPKDPNSSARRTVAGVLVNYDFNGDVGGAAPLTNPITFDGNLGRDAATAVSVAFTDSHPDANDFWNGALGADPQTALAGVPQTLLDSTGAETSATVAWSGFGYNYTNYTNGRDAGGGFTSGPNGDGFFNTGTARPTITIAGLDPALTYDIATIAAGDPVKFIVGAEEKNIQMWDSSLNAATRAVFDGVSPDGSGEIIVTVASINNARNFGIGGLQISFPVATPTSMTITGISRNATTGALTLSWTSTLGKSYSILWSTELASVPATVTGQSGIAGTNAIITRTFAPPDATAAKLFFRIKEQ